MPGNTSAMAANRLHLERLPGYAPDLHPDEGNWNYLKPVELGNLCATDLPGLRHRLRRATVRVRHKLDVIRACSQQCRYLP
jgi:transposase